MFIREEENIGKCTEGEKSWWEMRIEKKHENCH
jgi:hypothetical protein